MLFGAMLLLALRAIYRGFKQSAAAEANNDDVNKTLARRRWLSTDLVIALLLLGICIITTGSLHDSSDAEANPMALGYLLCKGQESCALDFTHSAVSTLEFCYGFSIIVFWVICIAVAYRWIRTVILTGKVRHGATIPDQFRLKDRVSAQRIVLATVICQAILIVYPVLRSTDADSRFNTLPIQAVDQPSKTAQMAIPSRAQNGQPVGGTTQERAQRPPASNETETAMSDPLNRPHDPCRLSRTHLINASVEIKDEAS
jgi:hypothetical protein